MQHEKRSLSEGRKKLCLPGVGYSYINLYSVRQWRRRTPVERRLNIHVALPCSSLPDSNDAGHRHVTYCNPIQLGE